MPKFFVAKDKILPTKVLLTGDDIYHIIKVLRKSIGDILEISDGDGTDYIVQIAEILKDSIIADIVSTHKTSTPELNITLYQSLPKSDKMELIIQKNTELGVSKIVPFVSERTIVEINSAKADKKLERWIKIAQEACKQCRRSVVPAIDKIHSFNNVLNEISEYDLTVLAYEKEYNIGLKQVLKNNSNAKNISVVIGPEGGFEENEAENLTKIGAKAITLGPRILRTETSGMAIISMIMYELGDMGEWIQ